MGAAPDGPHSSVRSRGNFLVRNRKPVTASRLRRRGRNRAQGDPGLRCARRVFCLVPLVALAAVVALCFFPGGGPVEGPAGPRSEQFYAGYFRDRDGNKLNAFCTG